MKEKFITTNTAYSVFTFGKVHSAKGGIVRLPSICETLGAKRVFLLSDEGLLKAGVVDRIKATFVHKSDAPAYLVGEFCGISSDAGSTSINKAIKAYIDSRADCILAVGGGSVIDASKALKTAIYEKKDDVRDILGYGVDFRYPSGPVTNIPHIIVPTTAGTGAESTQAAVIHDDETHIKGFIAVDNIAADVVVLDPELTLGLPPHLTAATGLDALCHNIEALTSQGAMSYTDAFAFYSTKIIKAHLPIVCKDGKNVYSRKLMLEASNMAAVAMITAVGSYPIHLFAHASGALYKIHHGYANAVLMPIVIEVCSDFYLPHIGKIASMLGVYDEQKSDEELLQIVVSDIRSFVKSLGLNNSFADKQIPTNDINNFIHAVMMDPTALLFKPSMEQMVAVFNKMIA